MVGRRDGRADWHFDVAVGKELTMQITVDRDKCDGFGFCEQAAPQLLRLDDEGEVEVLVDEFDNDHLGAAEAAVRSCPVAALRIVQ